MILLLQKNRRLLLFLLGVFVSTMGSGVTSTILPIFVLNRYHSALFLAIVLGGREVSVILCSPWLGAVVDKVGGYNTTLIALSLSALAVGSIPFDANWQPLIIVSYVVLGCGMALIAPTVGIYIPHLVDDADLERANGAFQVFYASANLIGMGF
ncbi:hypothetical protein BXT84_16035 [Sulfobacillus thermotolerans]|uniref:Major facilitator superfamily (MFS) profile domain-containing protein n=1 Tax=Sulfobacillus thermotolerans TaxID=338644 RepID=A0ABM6RV94_9FIRM|nr:hypothetical protein BXT84_16035 [Sulfobacillus thermotolerans]